MKVFNDRIVDIIKELIDLGVRDFSYYGKGEWGHNDRVDREIMKEREGR